jgi:hypothetical protein
VALVILPETGYDLMYRFLISSRSGLGSTPRAKPFVKQITMWKLIDL